MIINIIGQPGSGKTTLAKELAKGLKNSVIIDGDEIRLVSENKQYDTEGRIKNLKLGYNLALMFEKQGLVPIVAMVSPHDHLRQWLKIKSERCLQVRLTCSKERGREQYFAQDWEEPADSNLWLHFNTAIVPAEIISEAIITSI